ncbi:MAG: UDP-N-acetylmuramoyl-L-alanyl-D-glutamate--2,6-diaminopimelate ligase [Actinomycetales bacterium]|nr:MAG: UDP-N-acetylmuramoyl-L-alanyl-D-glutamate--2,6-diaminopimelate ligase [Actinomycetales bacterium]
MIRPLTQHRKSFLELAHFLGIDTQLVGEFGGISSTSIEVEPSDLFVALPGSKIHGASFIDSAVSAGAAAVLTDSAGAEIIGLALPVIIIENPRLVLGEICSWFYGSPSRQTWVAGVTGTNGKTTTCSLLNQIWRYSGKESGFIGTLGVEISDEYLKSSLTTPEAPQLQSLFATMMERHITHVAMEVSSHALMMGRVLGTHFRMVGFTNLTQDHLDFHGSMSEYFSAKSRLFTMQYGELGFINIDNEYGKRLFENSSIPVISLSRNNRKAEWHFDEIQATSNGFMVAIRGTGGVLIEGDLNLMGDHNLDNLLMAAAMAFHSEIDPIVIGNSFTTLMGAPGRLERIDLGQEFLALVDYAHTPDAVARTLATLRKSVTGQIIAVLGCGGDRDKTKRATMGSALLAGSDVAIFTSDNPRSETAEIILSQMIQGLILSPSSSVISDRRQAIRVAVSLASPGDCVIVLGKGHETGQEIAGVKYPFDDRLELAKSIEELS